MHQPFVSESQFEAIQQLLTEARGRFAPSELERFEQALLGAAGVVPRPQLAPLQDPAFYFPGLTARPWHEASRYPAVAATVELLESAAAGVREELLAVLETRQGFQRFPEGNEERADWNVVYLKGNSRKVLQNRELFPRTARLVDAIPRSGAGSMAMLSAVNPGGHIEPHCGPMNVRLTVHLGLVIPPDCRFRVGSESRTWQPGRCLVFDESFEHEVWNDSTQTRFVLLADLWHPELTDVEIELLERCDVILGKSGAVDQMVDAAQGRLDGQKWWA
ncbi:MULTISPECIES: aspartyl/asparaginyl beta-hydroxylase domain-containing protein [unclassified Corallococcus]|uniref:aspartyl/asparaginyl beta-hydroxylase domain-containing protein n=1 Tax=Corallococcus TaxID=83461 RepID=UPI001CC171F9|nr:MULTISPECIES: aspartyl/asparaginyl beta-hydroxylase domain-containing protein [unclassified Corallococcus]MBZ4329249.1 aspartyl/asparaginyl beta-hydroxylase domain-containing protein [Corallococcus sp. AS-1-12]MBZ4376467.1 aspartyl/asparaginyl beta-hydroxylase domain-containing protein [Corallococcus sp. AS-1-6]